MGHSGPPGDDTRTYEEQAHDYISAIAALLSETIKDQDARIEYDRQKINLQGGIHHE